MIKKVLIRGPALTRSGYGEHTRFVLRSLRSRQEQFDIYLHTTNWGETGWLKDDDEERKWMDSLLVKTIEHEQRNGTYDISFQVTIPNEWERLAPVNIGVTAGIETTRIAPIWLERANMMDRVITISEHSKKGFINTVYKGTHKDTNQEMVLKCETPVHVVHYPVRKHDVVDLDIDFEPDFNFLVMAQWGPRKNLVNTINWFVEEFIDQNVGLVLKIFGRNNSIIDRRAGYTQISELLARYPQRKCKVYLLHGDMTDQEIYSLYHHQKINAFVSLAHGEGFGLPLFEAAYCGMPVIAPDWSGHVDFLYMPVKNKKGKIRNRAAYAKVDYDLGPIQKEVVWDGVLLADSMWCYPKQGSYKMKLCEIYKEHGRYKKAAKQLQNHILENFTPEQQYERFLNSAFGEVVIENFDYIFVSDMFSEEIGTGTGVGGAELSLQNLIDECASKSVNINSRSLSKEILTTHAGKKWIFGNYSTADFNLLNLFAENGVDYSVVEFDYKFCRYRNLDLHKLLESEECTCAKHTHGKSIDKFLSGAKNIFFMSEKQRDIHLKELPNLDANKCIVLSSVFNEEKLDKMKKLREGNKDNKNNVWVALGTDNWVKGSKTAQQWCKENNLDFAVLENKTHDEALSMLAGAKGLCFTPAGADTCPRLVIEAKLLGCELHLNENVQHTEEEWFNTDDLNKIDSYLREVPQRFWSHFSE